MIQSDADSRTERFANGERVPQSESFRRQAEKRLCILEAAISLDDLRQLRSNRLEALKGDRARQYILGLIASGEFALSGLKMQMVRKRSQHSS